MMPLSEVVRIPTHVLERLRPCMQIQVRLLVWITQTHITSKYKHAADQIKQMNRLRNRYHVIRPYITGPVYYRCQRTSKQFTPDVHDSFPVHCRRQSRFEILQLYTLQNRFRQHEFPNFPSEYASHACRRNNVKYGFVNNI